MSLKLIKHTNIIPNMKKVGGNGNVFTQNDRKKPLLNQYFFSFSNS